MPSHDFDQYQCNDSQFSGTLDKRDDIQLAIGIGESRILPSNCTAAGRHKLIYGANADR